MRLLPWWVQFCLAYKRGSHMNHAYIGVSICPWVHGTSYCKEYNYLGIILVPGPRQVDANTIISLKIMQISIINEQLLGILNVEVWNKS